MASDAEDQALNELVQRLLIQPYPDAPLSVELHPGRLPADRSVDLPLPPDARLLGSAAYRRGGGLSRVEAIVDVPGAASTVVRAYEDQLRRNGWSVFGFYGGGFHPTGSGQPRSFRRGRGGPALIVNETERPSQVTSLRLHLNWEMPRQMPRHGHDMYERVPALLGPPDVEMEGGGGGGGDSNWSSTATAHTDKPPADLEAYFGEQLTVAGWTRVGGDSRDVQAWSSWIVPGPGSWIALLLVVAFERGERSLLLHVQAPARRQPRSSRSYAALRPWRPWWRRFSIRRPFG